MKLEIATVLSLIKMPYLYPKCVINRSSRRLNWIGFMTCQIFHNLWNIRNIHCTSSYSCNNCKIFEIKWLLCISLTIFSLYLYLQDRGLLNRRILSLYAFNKLATKIISSETRKKYLIFKSNLNVI